MSLSYRRSNFHHLVLTVFGLALVLTPALHAESSMGAIGGKFEDQSGSNYLKVTSITAGAPGDTAGLQVGDFIYKAFGEPFSNLSSNENNGWKGSVKEFGDAIERAESGNGTLPLGVLRPGVGNVDLDILLPAVGGFGPAFPLGSPKFDAMYQWACADIHSQVTASSDADFGQNSGLFGIILLSHPNWNDTAGAKPYRLSINKLKDRCVAYLASRVVTPVESTNLDGTPNDGSVDDSDPNDQDYFSPGLENWDICTAAMFIAEYRRKTSDSSVDATAQLAADLLANRVQDYQQPPHNGTTGPTRIGMMGHGGVGGDYAHLGWAGLNIINCQALSAMAMLKGAGATVNDDKFQKCWAYVKGSTNQGGGTEDGNVGYAYFGQSGWDSAGRTPGTLFGMENYGGISAADQLIVDKQKDYVVRHWDRMQHTHAYTIGGVYLTQFAIPYLNDRQQRHIMENIKYFYQFHRNAQGSLDYFGGRLNNVGDGYLNFNNVKLISVAMAQAVQSGNLPSFPAVNTARLHADFKAPVLTWPSVDARKATIRASFAAFNVDITDYLGTVLNTTDYTASWTHISGPATATFTSANTASTTVNFPTAGTYRIQLEITKGGYTLTEPIDLEVAPIATPAGYTIGGAEYRVYQNISGSAVTDLTSHANYPASPDITDTVATLEGTHSGNDYGSRIQGYIIPQVTGDYTFYIASDDTSEFKFGTSEAAAAKICEVSSWTSQYEWTKAAGQTSAVQTLMAGTPYFFEVNHKESSGGDHVAVAWTGPGVSTPTVISGIYLAKQDGGAAAITGHPTDQSAVAGGTASFNVQVSGQGPFLYEWTLDGVSYWPASTSSALDITNAGAGSAGTYQCQITSPSGTLTSGTAVLTVTGVGTLTQGGLWRDVYNDIRGDTIPELTGDASYPKFPDSGAVIATTEAPSNIGSNYGQRWTGWVKPDVTGSYTFYIASDDASELWLSTDDQPTNKVKLTQVNGYVGEKNWSSGGSAVVSLTSGNRYYIEVRHKEAGGGDHCAVTWQKPGDPAPTNGAGSIASQYLEYLIGGAQAQPVNISLTLVKPAAENVRIRPGIGLALELSASPALGTGDLITWTKESGPGNVTFENTNSLITGATFSVEGNYMLRCTVDGGGIPASVDVSVTVTSELASSWTSASIGEPTTGNGVVNGDGTYTVQGSGDDIYGTDDECQLFHQTISGDFDVRARIVSKSLTGSLGAHAQLMARETTATNSRNIAMTHERVDRAAFQYRLGSGAQTTYNSISNIGLPIWIRLVRSGGDPATGAAGQTFTGYYSQDSGVTWIQRQSITYTTAMPDDLMVGFAVSSAGTSLNTVVYDNVSGFAQTLNIGAIPDAGTDSATPTLTGISLSGASTDDGLPLTPGVITNAWTQVSGPGVATFADAAAANTTVSFSQHGVYVLRLSSSDGESTTYDDVTITTTNSPHVASDAAFVISEDAASGSSLGTVIVTDPDAEDIYTFTITSGNVGGAFAIDSSGNITTTTALNHEDVGSYLLDVSVTDTGGYTDTAAVAVTVADMDESAFTGLIAWEDAVYNGNTPIEKRTQPLAGNASASVDLSAVSGDATYEFIVEAEDFGQVAAGLLGGSSWSLRFEQWNNSNKLGITHSGVADYTASAEAGQSVASPYGSQAHVVYVVDTAGGLTRIYVNGVFVGSVNQLPVINSATSTLGSVTNIRNDANPGIHAFAAYNSALTTEEIITRYRAWFGESSPVDADDDDLDDAWELTHYGALDTVATTADTDGDGYTAFQEMVFGMDPTVNEPASAPVQNQIVDDGGTDKLEFKFRRPQNYATLNVTYQLQSSNDMIEVNWVDNMTTGAVSYDGNNEWITFLLPLPAGAEARNFWRCEVTPY